MLAGAGLLALHLGHVLAGQRAAPHVWFPPAGLGLVLVAWLGRRGALLVAVDALLFLLQRHFLGGTGSGGLGWGSLLAEVWCAGLEPLEAMTVWWLYHRASRGASRLDDPGSAVLFLCLVPGLGVGLFALLRGLTFWLAGLAEGSLLEWVALSWVSHALGIMALAPVLLSVFTHGLVRRGLVADELLHSSRQRGHSEPTRLLRGDWIELAGMALGAGILGLLLGYSRSGRTEGDWYLWGVSLLLIVWASVRQGLRGGTVVTATAAVVPLALDALLGRAGGAELVLQGNLLAQCSAGLLVTASANWVRGSEARYRRVVGQIPVVLYSARVVRPGQGGKPPAADITFVSPASRDVLGCAPEELLGGYDRWLVQVHPNDRELVLAARAQLGRQKEPVTCEYRLCAAERERWLRDTLVPLFGADGVLEGWDGVVADITEQRALANDLRQTTSMLNALVANLPAGVFFVEAPSGRPILVNARARKLLGQGEDSWAGLDHVVRVYRLHRPDGTPYPLDELPVVRAVRKGLPTLRTDIVVHRPGGQRVPLVSWAAPIDLRGQGQTDAAVWVLEDLTMLCQAETGRRGDSRFDVWLPSELKTTSPQAATPG